MTNLRMLQAALLVGLSVGISAACGPPETDIVATSSEGVGPWDVAHADVNGDALTADVCVSDVDAADVVSNRLLLQLRNKGYQKIDLSMYAGEENGGAQVRKVSWTPRGGKQMQEGGQSAQNPCNARDAANAPTSTREPVEGSRPTNH